MEGKKDTKKLGRTERSEFSDFLLDNTRKYFGELTPSNVAVAFVPYGSMARGNATENSSDVDMIAITESSAKEDVNALIDGSNHPSKLPIERYLMRELEKNRPDLYEERRHATFESIVTRLKRSSRADDQEKIKLVHTAEDLEAHFPYDYSIYYLGELNSIEVDVEIINSDDLVNHAKPSDMSEYGLKNAELSMGNWSSILGVVTNIDEDLVILPNSESAGVLLRAREAITNAVEQLGESDRTSVETSIAAGYKSFNADIKDRSDI